MYYTAIKFKNVKSLLSDYQNIDLQFYLINKSKLKISKFNQYDIGRVRETFLTQFYKQESNVCKVNIGTFD